MPLRWEASNVSYEGDQGGGDQQPDSRNGAQVLDGRQLLGRGLELALHLLHPCLDLPDLPTGLGKDRAQSFGQVRIGILDEGPYEGHDLPCAHRDEHAKLA